MTRSRSRWKHVRSGCSGSAWRRPRLSALRIPHGARKRASRSSCARRSTIGMAAQASAGGSWRTKWAGDDSDTTSCPWCSAMTA